MIELGDVALIKDDDPTPRMQWRMGKVLNLVKGRDDKVRGGAFQSGKADECVTFFYVLHRTSAFQAVRNSNSEIISVMMQIFLN